MLSFGTRKFNSLDKSFLLKNIINNNVTCVRPKIIKINKTNKFIELLVNINKLYCLKYYNIINKLNVNYVNNRIFRKNKNKNSYYYLELLFLRNRFFPRFFSSLENKTIFNVSLGMISVYFSKSKSFLRSKTSYLMIAVYLRRMLINMNLCNINLKIKGIPLHLNTILKSILTQSNVIYNNPFKNNSLINEVKGINSFFINFSYLIFVNNKDFGLKKTKKKGRLKRKIMRRVIINNNILD